MASLAHSKSLAARPSRLTRYIGLAREGTRNHNSLNSHSIRRHIATTSCRWTPSNVGGVGFAAKDAQVGEQAPEPLTVEGIKARRAKAGKLVAGTAAYSDSDMFKSPVRAPHTHSVCRTSVLTNRVTSMHSTSPRPRDGIVSSPPSSPPTPTPVTSRHQLTPPSDLLSPESLARKPCVLKQAAKHLKNPGLVSLGGGLPSADTFPFETMSMRIPTPPHFSEEETRVSGQDVTIGKRDVAEKDREFDLSIGLNYGQSIGAAQMLRWVTEHTELCHRPPYADWRCSLTIGSTGSLEAAYRMFCDRRRGDSVLTEEYSFSTALETAEPLGIKLVGAAIDEQGLLPESMDEILGRWDPAQRDGARKPTVLYTVPSGQNPTGATQGEQRRRDIYQVCSDHDVFILEDEPYYFLQMGPYTEGGPSAAAAPTNPSPASGSVDEFLAGLIPSLLSLDVDGRVMRHDSFSKVVVPGSRMGWITASEQIVERYIRHSECCSQGPSGFSQLAMHQLVDEQWGHEGYLRWLMHMRAKYTKRRNTILRACEQFLPREVVSWTPPAAGMFVSEPLSLPPILDIDPSISIYPDGWLTSTLALAEGRRVPPPGHRNQEPDGDRGGDLRLVHREGRAGVPGLVVPRREGEAPDLALLPDHVCRRVGGADGRRHRALRRRG